MLMSHMVMRFCTWSITWWFRWVNPITMSFLLLHSAATAWLTRWRYSCCHCHYLLVRSDWRRRNRCYCIIWTLSMMNFSLIKLMTFFIVLCMIVVDRSSISHEAEIFLWIFDRTECEITVFHSLSKNARMLVVNILPFLL